MTKQTEEQPRKGIYWEFWRLVREEPGRFRNVMVISAVSVGVSLLEGINVGLLIPLIEIMDSSEEGGGHWVSRAIASLFESLGVSFGLTSILVALAIVITTMAGN